MTIYCIDTCVWRDFYENRIGKCDNPLGKFAGDFFMKILTRRDTIIISKVLEIELKNIYDENEINEMFNLLFINGVIRNIELSESEFEKARILSRDRNLPLGDCIICVIAKNSQAIVISQDAHFLEDLSDRVEVKRPQDVS